MFEAVKKLFSELSDGDKQGFEDNDYRLAAAALLIHVATIDGTMSKAELAKVHDLVQQRFNLDDDATEKLLEEAIAAESESVDLYHFTSQLLRSLDEPGRERVIEMMWQIVYVDGHVSEFEDNLIWRAADLLGVPSEARIALRQRVVETMSPTDVKE
ncbi:MAG TPA: TerB family tellurite resistance protein [Xanthobacteraceae bacterium]|jgi:uncharacterized tellurite resistance protein B-like protein|nr:TerB family tellurite resistance protein [Xanthobacteraceae bacterium]